jgi:transposase
MAIVAGFDVHRARITFDAFDQETGELHRGRIPASPEGVRRWVGRFPDEVVHVAVEAGTGWLFVCEALREAGATRHLAEPAETSARRGKKRRAKTDHEDARWLRTLLAEGRLPEAWIPPAHVREWRTRTRLRKTLVDERTAWLVRVQATLLHHGVSGVPDKLLSASGREFLAGLELPAAASERIEVALQLIEAIDRQLRPLESELRRLARRQPGCRALMRHYGIGELTAPTILCELGDVARLSASRKGGALRRPRHRRAPLRPTFPRRQAHPTGLAAAALGALRVSAAGLQAHESRPRRLSRAQGTWTHAHQGLDHDRPQARPRLLPHATRARARGARTSHLTRTSPTPRRSLPPSPPVPDGTNLPASSLSCCDSRPRAALQQRPSGRSRSMRIDPSTITSPATRPRTQISPGARGTTVIHNHSPPRLDRGPGSDKR